MHNSVKILIPARNEARTIGEIIYRLKRMGFNDLIVVDGHSDDGTVSFAENLGARIIHQNGHGKGNALRQAFEQCLDADATVILDSDGSMVPEEVTHFVRTIEVGADVAKGSRFLPYGSSEDLTLTRRFGNTILTGLTNFLFFTRYTDLCYGYMAFSKQAIRKLTPCLEGQKFEIETEICVKAKSLGLKVVEIPSVERSRKYGRSNLNTFRDGVNILKLIVREALKNNR